MKCEYCGRTLRPGDTIQGLRYGMLTTTGFKASNESSVVVICEPCGTRICSIIYASLDPQKLPYPKIFNMYNDLTSLMKNGYKLIQSIANLPASDQKALQHLVTSCKSSR